jgi:transcriptional regulator with XRE-family HTH domain
MTSDPTFATRVRTLRLQRGLTQLTLAAKAQTSLTSVHMCERIGHVPNPALLARIACALGVDVAELRQLPTAAAPTATARRATA